MTQAEGNIYGAMPDLKGAAQLALKGRFRAPNAHYYGQFFFIINQANGFLDLASVIITTGSDLYTALNPTDSWKKYEALINKLKYENKYAQAITTEFQGKFKQLSIDKQFYADLSKALHSGKADDVNFLLSGFFRRVIKDEEFYLEAVTEEASMNDAAEPGGDPGAPADPNGLYLPVKLDLDPISGKDVKDIRPGDKILVRVLPQTERANSYIDSANLRTESGFIKSAPFTITSVTYPGVGVEFVGRLSDGVYGRIVEEQNVLVRTGEAPKKTGSAPQAQSALPASLPADKKQLILIGAGAGGVILLAAVLYWVISSL